MEVYKIIRIKILSKEPENVEPKPDLNFEDKPIVNNEEIHLESDTIFSEENSMLSSIDNESQEQGIKLTINDKVLESTDTVYEHEYISITACFHWKVTDSKIDDMEKTYLVGTNIITKNNDNLPTIMIKTSSESIKYKKLVRDNSKKLFGLRNKDIITIKHLNNKDNYHNYLVLLNNSKKLTSKFKNSINCIDKDTFKWRSYFGIYLPDKINPSKAEVYNTLSKDKNVTNTLSIDKNSLKLVNIYKSISRVIGELTY